MIVSQSQPSTVAGSDIPRSPASRRSVEESKSVNFHVVNALGTTLMTSDSADLARSWVRRHLWRFPSLRVVKVTHTVERETIYRPQLRSVK